MKFPLCSKLLGAPKMAEPLAKPKPFSSSKIVSAIGFILFFSPLAPSLFAEATNYSYNYDYWNEQVASPDPYHVSAYLVGDDFGIDNFRDPQGLFIRDNRIYICDSGNNRIVQLEVKPDGSYELTRIIRSFFIGEEESAFNYPSDLFETKDGELFICDTNSHRVVRLDKDANYVASKIKPIDESFDANAVFLPMKIIVDHAGRIFLQARNVNKGLMEFDKNGVFVGYMGANKVWVNPVDYIWKLISTQAQRARMDLFIPTEYNNLCLDNDGFIYVTNNSSWYIASVRRLNAMGQDILIRNGYEDPVGDLSFGNAGGVSGSSKFIDVAALDNDSYACFDRARGRIFMYDFQGNLLYAFGGLGNYKGYFLIPVAIDKMGYSLFALDSRAATLTRFDLTTYGLLINEALDEYKAGRYESSADKWEQVLKMNGNYDLAYIGIGRAALRQGDYLKAMEYYKLKRDDKDYGKAFQFYRKQWMEENLWKILLILAIVLIVPKLVKCILKFRKEVMEE
jgi:tetratricopeptide (TPR) repeat protein